MSHKNLSTKVGGAATQKSKPILQFGDFLSVNKVYKILLDNVSLFFKCVLNNLSKKSGNDKPIFSSLQKFRCFLCVYIKTKFPEPSIKNVVWKNVRRTYSLNMEL